MTLWGILSFLLRCVGLFQWAETAWGRHEAKIKQQNVADSPVTREELEETLKEGGL